MTRAKDPAFQESAAFASSDALWASTRPASLPMRQAARREAVVPKPSAASLAAAVDELLDAMASKRVPRLDALRLQLQQARGASELAELDQSLHTLHSSTTGLDLLAVVRGGEAHVQEFARQARAVRAAAEKLFTLSAEFLARQPADDAEARLLWVDLVLESGWLDKRVRQGAQWMAGMDQDLVKQQAAVSRPIERRALQELVRRGQELQDRLQKAHRLCSHSRKAQALGEQLAGHRGLLCTTLHGKVRPACARLNAALQPLVQAASHRRLEAGELVGVVDTRHELQVMLTQAGAEVIRMQDCDNQLGSQLAGMEINALGLS